MVEPQLPKLMTYLAAQKQTSKNNGRGSAPGRFEPVMMMFFLRFDRLVIAQ
jgi:hypothetical protein